MSLNKERSILNIKVNFGMSLVDVINSIEALLKSETLDPQIISTTNPEFIISAQTDEEFKAIINNSFLSIPDGSGLILADKYLNSINSYKKDSLFPIKCFFTGLTLGIKFLITPHAFEKPISGVDLMYEICRYANQNNKSIFLLGGWPKDILGNSRKVDYDLAQKTADELLKVFPNLKVIGSTSAFSFKESDDVSTVNYIHQDMLNSNVSHIDIVFVAYNHVNQEKWLVRNMDKIPARLGIGVGGSFDYISLNIHRAPSVVRHYHLEWLYRLFTQPSRIKRIFIAFPLFPLFVFVKSINK